MAAPTSVRQGHWDSFREERELRARRAWLVRFTAALSSVALIRDRRKSTTIAAPEAAAATDSPERPIVWSTQPVVPEDLMATGWWRFDARHGALEQMNVQPAQSTVQPPKPRAGNPFKRPSARVQRTG